MWRYIGLVAVTIVLSAALTILLQRKPPLPDLPELSLYQPYLHHFERLSHCLPPNSYERERLELAVQSLETAENGTDPDALTRGAEETLGLGIIRRGVTGPNRVCLPDDLAARIGKAIDRQTLLNDYPGEREMMLAGLALPPSNYAVRQVAKLAFNPSAGSPREHDARPLARTVLASFGEAGEVYGARAFREMAADTAMGTTAAQIAAATHVPGALNRIESLVRDKLADVPKESPIPLALKERLYDLSLAIYFAGAEGQAHVGTVEAIMARKVESNATVFGIISLPPKRLCIVLERIQPSELEKFPYCKSSTPDDS